MALTLPNTFLQKNPSVPTPSPLKGSKAGEGWKVMRCSCRKKDIHPEFYEDAKVYCNGELVMTTGGAKQEYVVDVWSGNHPFYLGTRSELAVEADQIEKFRRKYPGLPADFYEVPVLRGELVIPDKFRRKSNKGKKK